MSLVLAFDTATPIGSVAVVRDGVVLATRTTDAGLRHAETLLTEIERALADSHVAIGDVEVVAVGIGPGSFTGLRIALATAKGLALARPLKVVGVSSLAALARSLGGKGEEEEGQVIIPLLDAHKGEVFGGVYRAHLSGPLTTLLSPFSLPPSRVQEVVAPFIAAGALLCGDGLRLLSPEASTAVRFPEGGALADEAMRLLASRGADDVGTLEPIYVRDADTT